MYVEYEEQCGNCIEFDYKGSNRKGYCSWYKSYYYPGDSCNHQKPRLKSTDSNCYITTIISQLVGENDNCDTLNTLRNFRDNILTKNEKYKEILYEYDEVGPKLAISLQKDYYGKNKDAINRIYKYYLVCIAKLIENNKHDDAIELYTFLVKTLEEYYKIDIDYSSYQDYDYSKGGHGKIYKK